MRARPLSFLLALLLFAAAAPIRAEPAAPAEDAAGRGSVTLVWVSVDGIRPDYLDRADTPFFDRLAEEGLHTRTLRPLFPSLTFPMHVTQATGVSVETHGITGNVIYDSARDRSYGYPNFPWLLEAEPIWTTATRQGVPTAVFGWPLSHRQAGARKARHFDEKFDRALTDRQRLDHLLDTWESDSSSPPLRLLMGYAVGPDSAGHRHGPDAEETALAMAETDRLLGRFEQRMLALWQERRRPGDILYLLVSSDHGMSAVHTLVNLRRCAGLPPRSPQVRLVTGGTVGHVFFNRIEDEEGRAAMRQRVRASLQAHPFMDVHERERLPERWGYRHPRRTGDLVVVLPPGYAFNGRIRRETVPAAEAGEPLGMHGHALEQTEDMLTVAFFQRYPDALGGVDIGAASMDRLHVTVARLLEIDPAPGARKDVLTPLLFPDP